MLLFSLVVTFLSPFTAFSVNAVTLPRITSFTSSIDEYADDRGKRLVLKCRVSGEPTPRIDFQKDGIMLRNHSKLRRITDEELHINNVSYENDDGLYRCVATNDHGKVFKEKPIRIKAFGKFLPGEQFTDTPFNELVQINAGKKLHCPQHSHAYPVKYFWAFKNPRTNRIKTFELQRRHHLLNNGEILFFSMVTKKDVELINNEGGLSCVLNVAGDTDFSRRFKLKPYGEPITKDIPPAIYGELHGTNYVIKGESLTLQCSAAGNPMPSVKWYKNGVEINVNDSTKYEINLSSPERLTLIEVKKEMEGEYKCLFKNRAGTANSKSKIIVAELPKIKIPLPEVTRENLGKRLRLLCNATGTGPFNYTWYRNGSQLSSYSAENYTMKVDGAILDISRLRYNDAGTYQCFVSSKYGEVSGATKVAVEAPSVIGGIGGGRDNDSSNTTTTGGSPMELKYIIIIACSATVAAVLVCGGVFMYCRTKKDKEQEEFIPTPKPPYNDYQQQKNQQNDNRYEKPMYDLPNPPTEFTESDDDGMSTFRKGKSPEMTELMMNNTKSSTADVSSDATQSEHYYYDIPEDGKSSISPSTEL